MRRAVEATERLTITHEFTDGPDDRVTGCEVLRDGMTFDLSGLAPGQAAAIGPLLHRYGFDSLAADLEFEAVALQPGPHLAAGAHSIPVVRSMMAIAADLQPHLPDMRALSWPPAASLVGPGFFSSSIGAWQRGGPFPALGLTALVEDPDGGMSSQGLSWFTGQEVRLAPELAKDRVAAAMLGMRLINQLVFQGKLAVNEAIIGPDGGRLALEPTRDGRTVRVRRG